MTQVNLVSVIADTACDHCPSIAGQRCVKPDGTPLLVKNTHSKRRQLWISAQPVRKDMKLEHLVSLLNAWADPALVGDSRQNTGLKLVELVLARDTFDPNSLLGATNRGGYAIVIEAWLRQLTTTGVWACWTALNETLAETRKQLLAGLDSLPAEEAEAA